MKRIGLVGGISWTSTLDYYKYLNEGVNRELGGLESAECLIYSINFGDIHKTENGWEGAFDLLYDACKTIEDKVDAIALCANTAHLFADEIQSKIKVPLINIASSTAEVIKKHNLSKVALLGTKFTMQMNFYKDKLSTYDIETIIPDSIEEINEIHRIIKDELGKGVIKPGSKKAFLKFSNKLIEQGAQGIVLGCTEIPLLIGQEDFNNFPVFDTTKIHVERLIDFVLNRKTVANKVV